MENYHQWIQQVQNNPEIHQQFIQWYEQNIQKESTYLEQGMDTLEYFVETGFLTDDEIELFFNFLEVQTAISSVHQSSPTLLENQTPQTPFSELNTILELEPKNFLPYPARQETSSQRFGSYEILSKLAEGGMGTVYKVLHHDLKTIYALKVMKVYPETAEEWLRRFQKEAQITAKLQHPHIVQVIDFGREGQEYYFCMEFVEGITFAHLIEKKISIRNALRIIQKTLKALEYAHSQGIIHRDIKPENIFITIENEPKIGDFGLAKDRSTTNPLTQAGTIMGTPAYMPPEQVLGQIEALDVTADIYSTGLCLYELLIGKRFYRHENVHEIFYRILHEEIPPCSRFNPKIHQDLDTILLKSLEKDPLRRYLSASAFAEDIERFLNGYPILAHPPKLSEKVFKWFKRNPKRTLFLGSGVLLFGALLFFVLFVPSLQKKAEVKAIFEKAIFAQNEAKMQEQVAQKMNTLLQAFNYLNQALLLNPGEPSLEQVKWQVIQDTIPALCSIRAYELAKYFAQEASTLSWIQNAEVFALLEQIEQSQHQIATQHLQRFQYWQERLSQEILEDFSKKEALFEITQMPEEEITEKLVQILQEGTRYYLKNTPPDPLRCQYYQTMVQALGRQGGNKNIKTQVLQCYIEIKQHILKIPLDTTKEKLFDFAVSLTHTIANLKIPDLAMEIFSFRAEMGMGSLFWIKTQAANEKLARLDGKKLETPKNAEEFHSRAAMKFSRGDFEGAIQDYTSAIQQNPKNVNNYVNRGVAKKNKGDFTGAIQDYNIALRLEPSNANAIANRGLARVHLKDFEGAIQDYTQGLKLESSPQHKSLVHSNRAVAYMNLKKFKEALADCEISIQLNPQYISAYNFRGKIKLNAGDQAGAIQDFLAVLEKSPEFEDAYFNLGVIYYNQQNMEKSRLYFEIYLQKTRYKNQLDVSQNTQTIFSVFPDLKNK